MPTHLRFHHIGIATRNFEKAMKTYLSMGFSVLKGPVEAPTQNVRVCFLEKTGHPMIELIEPVGDESPVRNLLKRNGSGPYHLCYIAENIQDTIETLKAEKYFILSKPVQSKPFNDNLIVFAYKEEIGLIEIVECKPV